MSVDGASKPYCVNLPCCEDALAGRTTQTISMPLGALTALALPWLMRRRARRDQGPCGILSTGGVRIMATKMLLFFAASSWIAWVLLITGLQTRKELRQRNEVEHTRATGTIVDYARKERRGKGGVSVYWKPVVAFTADGQTHRAEYENWMDKDEYPVGTEVDVLYDVSNPSRFHLEADPVFTDPGGGAIRISLIWILLSAALTIALAVFVGGTRFDFRQLWWDIQTAFRRR